MIFLEGLSENAKGLLIFCFFIALCAGISFYHSRWLKDFWIRAGRPTQAEAPEHKDWRIWRNHGYALVFSTVVLFTIALALPGK
jgi:hypothetical protein